MIPNIVVPIPTPIHSGGGDSKAAFSCVYCYICDCAMFEYRRLVAQWVEV